MRTTALEGLEGLVEWVGGGARVEQPGPRAGAGERRDGAGEREEDGVGRRVGGREGGGIIRLLGDCVGGGAENRGTGGRIWGFGAGSGSGSERFRVGTGALSTTIVADALGVDCSSLSSMSSLASCGCWTTSAGGACRFCRPSSVCFSSLVSG